MKKIIILLMVQSISIWPLYKGNVAKINSLAPQAGTYGLASVGLFKPTTMNLAPKNNWWDKKRNRLFDIYTNYQPMYEDYLRELSYKEFKNLADTGSKTYLDMHPKFKSLKRTIEDISEDIYKTLYPEEKKKPETIKELWESIAKERSRAWEDINDFFKYKFVQAGAKIAPELYKIDMILTDLVEKISLQQKFYTKRPYTDEEKMDVKRLLWIILILGVTGETIGLAHDLYSLLHEYTIVKKQDIDLKQETK